MLQLPERALCGNVWSCSAVPTESVGVMGAIVFGSVSSDISLSASMKSPETAVIGIDVGGTKIAAGVIRFPTAEVLLRRLVATGPERGSAEVLADVVRLAAELR